MRDAISQIDEREQRAELDAQRGLRTRPVIARIAMARRARRDRVNRACLIVI